MDAKRLCDGQVVVLKRVRKGSTEESIGRFLGSEELRDDPRNHAAPLVDVYSIEGDYLSVYLVFPLLRDIQEPPLASISECVDFVEQTLEVSLSETARTNHSPTNHYDRDLRFFIEMVWLIGENRLRT